MTGTGGGRIILHVAKDRGTFAAKGFGLKSVSIICRPATDPSSFVLYLKEGKEKEKKEHKCQEEDGRESAAFNQIMFCVLLVVRNDVPEHAREAGVAANRVNGWVHGPESLRSYGIGQYCQH